MAQVTACSTLGFTHFSIDVAARQIANLGFKKIEIAHMGLRCRHYTLGEEDPYRIRELFAELDLTPVATNYSTGWIKDGEKIGSLADPGDAEFLEARIQRLLQELSVIGVPLLTIPVGRRTESPDRRKLVEHGARVINRLGDYASRCGVRLALEVPHSWDLYNTLERVQEMFELVTSSNVGALIDSSHWAVLAYDLEDWYRVAGDRLWHVHLRDGGVETTTATTVEAPQPQELEKTAGRGTCDFLTLGRWLDAHGYQGEVSLEFEYRDPAMSWSDIRAEYDFGLKFLRGNEWSVPPEVLKNLGTG